METIHHPLPTPSKQRMFDDWNTTSTHQDSDPPYLPFTQPSAPNTLHPFVTGVLETSSRRLQCAAFQAITGHSFQGNYSLRHRPTAPDNTTCPHCSHFIHCNCLIINHSLSLHTLFSTKLGGRRLCEFLKMANTLLRPLPPWPDQPRDPT
jgi:hypothetical protein